MKLALKLLAGVGLLVLVAAGGIYAWAAHRDRALLGRRVATHHAGFPIPFPLTPAELDSITASRRAEGVRGDPTAGLDGDSIARARAVARGDHLVHARYGCVECHGQDFGGGVMMDNPLVGRVLGPNITAGPGGRTAGFTASDWDRIVRHGVKHDGLPAVMPSVDFQSMSDQELSDIVSYIRSLPPVNRTVPPPHLGPLGTVLLATGALRLSVDLIPDHTAPHARRPPPTDTTAAFGKHLATVCEGCHGPSLAGGPIHGGDPSWPPAMNLTPASDGLAGWTYAQFAATLRTGKRPNGTSLRPPMTAMVGYARRMSEVELRALWAYVSTVPPVASKR